MDPAALGTTIIGLDAIRRDEALDQQAVVRPGRRRRRVGFARQRLADLLRGAAERLAPAPAAG